MTPMVHGDVSPRDARRTGGASAVGRGEMRLRTALALVTWMAGAAVVEVAVGDEFSQVSRQVEERLELQILGSPAAPSPAAPERTREDSIEPWELVGV
jgi:hypothetical protein